MIECSAFVPQKQPFMLILFLQLLNLSRFTHFSWGKIWFRRFAPCKRFDISQLCGHLNIFVSKRCYERISEKIIGSTIFECSNILIYLSHSALGIFWANPEHMERTLRQHSLNQQSAPTSLDMLTLFHTRGMHWAQPTFLQLSHLGPCYKFHFQLPLQSSSYHGHHSQDDIGIGRILVLVIILKKTILSVKNF